VKTAVYPVTMRRSQLFVLAPWAMGTMAKNLWANVSADPNNIIMTAYPVGNGKLGGQFIDEHFEMA
jgi:hypothetical protein